MELGSYFYQLHNHWLMNGTWFLFLSITQSLTHEWNLVLIFINYTIIDSWMELGSYLYQLHNHWLMNGTWFLFLSITQSLTHEWNLVLIFINYTIIISKAILRKPLIPMVTHTWKRQLSINSLRTCDGILHNRPNRCWLTSFTNPEPLSEPMQSMRNSSESSVLEGTQQKTSL